MRQRNVGNGDVRQPLILVLGTADWNQKIATNQHYIVRELAEENRVIFVESMGLRRPELKRRDIERILARLKTMVRWGKHGHTPGVRPLPRGVQVVAPRVIPTHGGAAAWLNRFLIRRQLAEWIDFHGRKLLWTYSPVTYGLEAESGHTVYHCVDLLGDFSGISSDLIGRSERKIADAGVHAVASSEVVLRHLIDGPGFKDVRLWPNVADTSVIQNRRPRSVQREEGSVVFAGNITAGKVDFSLLRRVLEDGRVLHLAGPIAEGGGDARTEVNGLISRGATYHGLLALPELAEVYWRCEIGIIPYVINRYTTGVNPLKTYEYLAAGLGVVSTSIPAVESRHGDVIVANDVETFVAAIENLDEASDEVTDRRAAIARSHSWIGRGKEARDLAEALAKPS